MGLPGGSVVKNLPANVGTQEMPVQSLGQEDPLEEEMATHSSILAWKIPWTEEPGRLEPTGSKRVGHDWARCKQKHIYSGTDFPAAPMVKTLPHLVSRRCDLTSTCNSENELHESGPLFTYSPGVHEDCKTEEKEGVWTGPVYLGSQESIFNMQNKSWRKKFKSCTKMCFPHHLLAHPLQNPSPPI